MSRVELVLDGAFDVLGFWLDGEILAAQEATKRKIEIRLFVQANDFHTRIEATKA